MVLPTVHKLGFFRQLPLEILSRRNQGFHTRVRIEGAGVIRCDAERGEEKSYEKESHESQFV
jgi:hypothetical protein